MALWLVVATAALGSLAIAAVVLRTDERGGSTLFLGLIAFVVAAGALGGAAIGTDGRWYRTFVVAAIVAATVNGGLAVSYSTEHTWCRPEPASSENRPFDCTTASVPAALFTAPLAYALVLPGVAAGSLFRAGVRRALRRS